MKVFVLFDIENSRLGNIIFAGLGTYVQLRRSTGQENILTIVQPAASKG